MATLGTENNKGCKVEAAIIAINQRYSEGSNQCIEIRKRIRDVKMRRKGVKSFRITSDTIVYLGNPRESTEKLQNQ